LIFFSAKKPEVEKQVLFLATRIYKIVID